MSTSSPDGGATLPVVTDRARVTYQGDETIFLPGFLSPTPDRVEPDDVVEVDAEYVGGLLARGDFAAGGTLPDVPRDAVPEPVPEGRRIAEAQAAAQAELDDAPEDAGQLKGDALDDALRAAGLPLSGTADEKRDRLADHVDALASQAISTQTPTTTGA